MALTVPSLELSNTGLIVENGYARVTAFSWDITNYTKLSVIVSTWKDGDSFLSNKNRLFISQHIIDISSHPNYRTAYNTVADLIYTHLINTVDVFANSTIVE